MRIAIADPGDPALHALLRAHLEHAAAHTPAGSGHALDVAGLRHPDLTLWAARDGETIVGCVALRQLEPGHGEIKSMHTAAAMRGRGIARALVTELIGEARRRGYTRLSLETGRSEGFAASRALYAAFGFEPCPPFGDYVGDDFSYCMTRGL